MKYTKEELCLIWLDSFLGLEYKHKQMLCKYIEEDEDITKLIKRNKGYIVENIGENEYNTLINSVNNVYMQYVVDGLNRRGIVAITILSEKYPKELAETDIPPLVLYAKGNIDLLESEKFAIVGSRKSLPLSIALAKDFSKEIGKNGFTLITGIAEGVDKAVLESCIDNGLNVISVLASGFDNVYPQSHIDIFNKVCEFGLVLTEYPPEVVARPYFFPVRNRIIAGLSKGVLIASGGLKSGTFYTAQYAGEYGRDLFSIPYSVGVASGEGCNELIKKGAMLVDRPQDVLEYYGIKQESEKVILDESEKEIVKAIRSGITHIDKICEATGRPVYEVNTFLSILEIKGVVVKTGVNSYGLQKANLEE